MSFADITSKVSVVDPHVQERLIVESKLREQQRQLQMKREAEAQKRFEEIDRAKKAGRVKGFARVKAVYSGDAILLVGQATSPNTPPPEKLLVLAGIDAPKIGRKGNPDEPFAFMSKEFVRNMLIGKTVEFAVIQVLEPSGTSIGNIVFENQDLAEVIVANGWAKVKDSKNKTNVISPYVVSTLSLFKFP